jgi:hypothetical protein
MCTSKSETRRLLDTFYAYCYIFQFLNDTFKQFCLSLIDELNGKSVYAEVSSRPSSDSVTEIIPCPYFFTSKNRTDYILEIWFQSLIEIVRTFDSITFNESDLEFPMATMNEKATNPEELAVDNDRPVRDGERLVRDEDQPTVDQDQSAHDDHRSTGVHDRSMVETENQSVRSLDRSMVETENQSVRSLDRSMVGKENQPMLRTGNGSLVYRRDGHPIVLGKSVLQIEKRKSKEKPFYFRARSERHSGDSKSGQAFRVHQTVNSHKRNLRFILFSILCRRERTDLRDLFARDASINGDMRQRKFFVGDTCKFDIIRSKFF